MKRIYILSILALAAVLPQSMYAQDVDSAMSYRRSSLYSFMISHPDKKMDSEIVGAFMALETPDKYNNHDLSVKCITSDSNKEDLQLEVEEFFVRNDVAKRLVSKWFLRSKETGGFEPSLVLDRGLYDASALDVEAASQTKRGVDALADGGYELINNTFVIVNDITYVDHEANADEAKKWLDGIGEVAKIFTGGDENIVSSLASIASTVSSMIAGFAVNTTSYLYQLDWNDSVANYFYDNYYYDKPALDSASQAAFYADAEIAARKAAFEADDSTFRLKYVGSYKARSDNPVLRGLYNPEDVFRKVCARAIDKNVMNLQKNFDQFKVKIPISSVDAEAKTVTAKIGMKEGVTAKSKYEILVPVFDEATGKFKYNRKGTLKPDPNKIWDNRYMASDEQAVGSELNATTFKITGGVGILPGMLIREIK